uniref:Uncharacterized protein n=1 Tax=Attheya septentrionalis TaxID=420275 RepID=A0A7S2XNX8_9STRA|mmetsp:Transcript_23196/g.41907  ORF Transcript_23196/g.41907 Transcript_23196/m.41907 type:complete len:591 (+) Transcript_23196:301-2073(+)|eukprot:CAMPEP_0198292762 /NCGR_PEP_ID=MMETSP1449-20131203/13847_1 /TAXON_ID=420275 /ORGANISM="Attheya septentrionalis, Strain CCMP2084" /LENGTH=590 /DNA_ID=CAMNT_0043992051 /DNA_START=243 /DNA_END=2015 /DNA_ORIENTATION=+
MTIDVTNSMESTILDRKIVDYQKNPSRIFQLLARELWEGAQELVEHKPSEASIWIARSLKRTKSKEHWEFLPLHIACMNCDFCPGDSINKLILKLIEVYPAGVSTPDFCGDLPLHHALRSGANSTVIAALLLPNLETLEYKDSQGKNAMEILLSIGHDKGTLEDLLPLLRRVQKSLSSKKEHSENDDHKFYESRDPIEESSKISFDNESVILGGKSFEMSEKDKEIEALRDVISLQNKHVNELQDQLKRRSGVLDKGAGNKETENFKSTLDKVKEKMSETFTKKLKEQHEHATQLESEVERLESCNNALKRERDVLTFESVKLKLAIERWKITAEQQDSTELAKSKLEESFKREIADLFTELTKSHRSEANLQEDLINLTKENGRRKNDMIVSRSTIAGLEVEIAALRRKIVGEPSFASPFRVSTAEMLTLSNKEQTPTPELATSEVGQQEQDQRDERGHLQEIGRQMFDEMIRQQGPIESKKDETEHNTLKIARQIVDDMMREKINTYGIECPPSNSKLNKTTAHDNNAVLPNTPNTNTKKHSGQDGTPSSSPLPPKFHNSYQSRVKRRDKVKPRNTAYKSVVMKTANT